MRSVSTIFSELEAALGAEMPAAFKQAYEIEDPKAFASGDLSVVRADPLMSLADLSNTLRAHARQRASDSNLPRLLPLFPPAGREMVALTLDSQLTGSAGSVVSYWIDTGDFEELQVSLESILAER